MFAATGSRCPSSHPCAAQGHRAHCPPPGKRPLLSEGRRGITPVPRSNAFPRRVLLPPQSARACGHPSPAPKLHHRVVPGAGSSGRYQRRGRAAAQLTLHGGAASGAGRELPGAPPLPADTGLSLEVTSSRDSHARPRERSRRAGMGSAMAAQGPAEAARRCGIRSGALAEHRTRPWFVWFF